MRKLYFLFILVAVIIGLIIGINHRRQNGQVEQEVTSEQPQYSPDQANSLWVVVNKGRQLPANYVPSPLVRPNVSVRPNATSDESQLRSDAAAALVDMFQAAKAQGINLMLASGYRSYQTQQSVYGYLSQTQGQSTADETSARPGHSEHQTGLAADVEPTSRECEVEVCFADMPEGKWLAANSYKFGFIIRYGQNSQQLTGYTYEPWHIRYVGKQLAATLYASGKTLEQYFKLPAYPDYPAQAYQLK